MEEKELIEALEKSVELWEKIQQHKEQLDAIEKAEEIINLIRKDSVN